MSWNLSRMSFMVEEVRVQEQSWEAEVLAQTLIDSTLPVRAITYNLVA